MLRTRSSLKAVVNGKPVFMRAAAATAKPVSTTVPTPVAVEVPPETKRAPFSKPKKVEQRKQAPVAKGEKKITDVKKQTRPSGKRTKTSKKK